MNSANESAELANKRNLRMKHRRGARRLFGQHAKVIYADECEDNIGEREGTLLEMWRIHPDEYGPKD